MVRFVGRNDLSLVTPWIAEWATTISTWMQSGLRPVVFTHAPDDVFDPEFARQLHNAIRVSWPALPALPPWPGEIERATRKTQRSLF